MSESSRDNPIESELEKLKISTEPKSLEFSDLSDDAIGMIIDELDLKERLVLRKVSRGLRTLVDQKKSILKTLKVTGEADHICVSYNNKKVAYGLPTSALIRYFKETCHYKVIESENYSKVALDDLQFVFRDPTVQLNKLDVRYHHCYDVDRKAISFNTENFSEGLKNLLTSLEHKVSTKHFRIRESWTHEFLNFLLYLKPSTLRVIEFGNANWNSMESGMVRIVDSEQWKQATGLRLQHSMRMLPKQHLMHFKWFWMRSYCWDPEKILEWRDLFATSERFESGEMIGLGFGMDIDIQNHLGDIISTEGEGLNQKYTIHHPMATDSNQIMEIKVQRGTISFTKIARPL